MLSRQVRKFIIYMIVILLLFCAGWFYFLKFKPLQARIADLETSIKEEETTIGVLGKKDKEPVKINTTALQRKLPVSELVDQFVLLLEEVEVASGSLITNVSFKDSQAGDTTTGNLAEEYEAGQTQRTEETTTTNPPPEGVKKLTASITVESPSYLELESFVKGLEELERITKVESLTFTGTKGSGMLTNAADGLTYSLTVATYYYPKLEELKNQLPKYQEPKPANKINPLDEAEPPVEKKEPTSPNQSTPAPSKKDESSDSTIVKRNQTTYNVYTYRVKPGDTLFQLAITYYNSRKGEKIIKDWNHLNQLEANTTIEIPVPTDGEN